MDTQRGIYLSSGYEVPGPLFALGCGRGRSAHRDRRARPRHRHPSAQPARPGAHAHLEAGARAAPALGELHEPRGRVTWSFETARRFVLRRGAQQASRPRSRSCAPCFKSFIIRYRRASRWLARSATIYCSSSIPSSANLPRHDVKDLHLLPVRRHLFYGSQRRSASSVTNTDFACGSATTAGLPRTSEKLKAGKKVKAGPIVSDHTPKNTWPRSRPCAKHAPGRLLRVCLRQTFAARLLRRPSDLFDKIQHASPSPYEFFLQLARSNNRRPRPNVRAHRRPPLETCPICRTARRTGDPLRDADNIRELLNSAKEGRN